MDKVSLTLPKMTVDCFERNLKVCRMCKSNRFGWYLCSTFEQKVLMLRMKYLLFLLKVYMLKTTGNVNEQEFPSCFSLWVNML